MATATVEQEEEIHVFQPAWLGRRPAPPEPAAFAILTAPFTVLDMSCTSSRHMQDRTLGTSWNTRQACHLSGDEVR